MADTTYGAAHAESLVGTELAGGYQLLELLGTGGMGAVFKAKQAEFDTLVAVKLVHPGADFDSSNLQRLQREAQVLGALQHPAIPKIHSIKQLSDGGIFIAIDFIDGRSLQYELESRGKLPRELAADITSQIAIALAHAHEKGVIHRDLKPANIMLSGAGKETHVHVLDFGIAKKLEGSQKFTRTGAIVGTAYYMSPEQARGEAVDQRCDIYSLGCVFYEMLTGKRLFDGDTQMEVLLRHVQETLPDLNLPELGPYGGVLAKALAKDPDERFASMRDFEQALRNPGGIAVPGSKRASVRFPARVLVLGAALLVAGGIAWSLSQTHSPTKPRVLDSEVTGIIHDAWKARDFRAARLDEAIAVASDPTRDTFKGDRAADLEIAGLIRLIQHRDEEAKRLFEQSVARAKEVHQPALAVRNLADLQFRTNQPAAIELLRKEVSENEAHGLGNSDKALSLRYALAQKYEQAGHLPEAAIAYKALMDHAKNTYAYGSIGCIGCADVLNQMGNRQGGLLLIGKWLQENDKKKEAWEFLPWAVNVRAALETDLNHQRTLYDYARKFAEADLQSNNAYMNDHPTTAIRMWRAKVTSELGLAKVAFLEKKFKLSDDWMDEAMKTCTEANDPALEAFVRKWRFVHPAKSTK